MCGIFGAVSLSGAPLKHPDCVAAMAAALAHRGPDGERIVGHERARLGARRLAIMDLTTGDQPFQSPDASIWMVCNGEIYNAPELRREYTLAGYPFRSTGDIETIVPLYERFGADGVGRLEGMFGLAVWDDRHARLVLARDRAGEKPLFWTEVNGELRFASEIQALLAFPDQPRRVNAAAAALYGALGYVPAPYTMLDGISKLAPAHLLVADRKGLACAATGTPPPSPRGPRGSTDRPRCATCCSARSSASSCRTYRWACSPAAGLIPRCSRPRQRGSCRASGSTRTPSSSPNRATTRALTPKR